MGVSRRDDFIADALASDTNDCLIWPFAVRKSSGYPAHNYRRDGKKTNVDAHRFVCAEAHGTPFDGAEASHKCGVKTCINPRHLYWADHQQNMNDAKAHGRLRGGGRYRQYLFEPDINEICTSSKSLLALAEKFGTDAAYISRIRREHAARIEGGA